MKIAFALSCACVGLLASSVVAETRVNTRPHIAAALAARGNSALQEQQPQQAQQPAQVTQYDCDSKTAWTLDQTKWCCSNFRIGCLDTANINSVFLSREIDSNGDSKTSQTTTQTKTAATEASTTSTKKYNCRTRERWPAAKRAWCCEHNNLGCPPSPPALAPATEGRGESQLKVTPPNQPKEDEKVTLVTPMMVSRMAASASSSSTPLPKHHCDLDCPEVFEPLCGSDGVTYGNKCLLKVAVCKNKGGISVTHPGECYKRERPITQAKDLPSIPLISIPANGAPANEQTKDTCCRDRSLKCLACHEGLTPYQLCNRAAQPLPTSVRSSLCTPHYNCRTRELRNPQKQAYCKSLSSSEGGSISTVKRNPVLNPFLNTHAENGHVNTPEEKGTTSASAKTTATLATRAALLESLQQSLQQQQQQQQQLQLEHHHYMPATFPVRYVSLHKHTPTELYLVWVEPEMHVEMQEELNSQHGNACLQYEYIVTYKPVHAKNGEEAEAAEARTFTTLSPHITLSNLTPHTRYHIEIVARHEGAPESSAVLVAYRTRNAHKNNNSSSNHLRSRMALRDDDPEEEGKSRGGGGGGGGGEEGGEEEELGYLERHGSMFTGFEREEGEEGGSHQKIEVYSGVREVTPFAVKEDGLL